jgi:hypothetical protein
MSYPNKVLWTALPRSTKALVWCASVTIGAMIGLWLLILTRPYSPLTYFAYFTFPFIGSDLLVYGNMRFWQRPRDERKESRGGFAFGGYICALALSEFLRVELLELPLC